MSALDHKLIRDLRRLWAQVLAISLVIAAGIATMIMSIGSYQSLDDTRAAYYDRYQFADVFATVRRAPRTVLPAIAAIPGVAAVEGRVAGLALLAVDGFPQPATGQFVSLPESGEPGLNRLYMRLGRLPAPASSTEVVVDEGFAEAHGFQPGDRFSAVMNGRRRDLVIAGVALSPEFVYAIGPGDIMPDPRRFGVVWMPEKALASAYDLEGAVSSIAVRLSRGASEREVIRQVDSILDRYGGQAAFGRKDQVSHAFLEHELDMLRNMSRTLPPIFLLVGAFLVNITLSRLVSLEREQIGLLKALGYTTRALALHYIKFVSLLVLLGVVIGSAAGTWLGIFITRMFGDFFRFPFLVFTWPPGVYAAAAALSLAAAGIGAARALREVAALSPAVAMQPPAPPRFRHVLPARITRAGLVSAPTAMALRTMLRHPVRGAFTALGMALATAILVVSLFTRDTMENLIDVTYFLADRQDATVSFVDKKGASARTEIGRLPGVLRAEPVRYLPVRIRRGNVERRIMVSGRSPDADLNRVIDVNLRPVSLPDEGIAISALLGQILGVGVGDLVELDLLEGSRRTVTAPVSALVEDYFGIRGMMTADAMARLLREAPTVSAVSVALDKSELDAFYVAIKRTPAVSGVAFQWVSLAKFRETLALMITTMASIYTGLAAIIAFGVVYNSARIALSERARELASLRVLGFTNAEVFWILLLELAILTAAAQPAGWAMGYGLAWVMQNNLAGELMRVRLVVASSTYVLASAVVVAAAVASAWVVRGRIAGLDLVAVLKTRD
jgi:putative ABC transport system permease protein